MSQAPATPANIVLEGHTDRVSAVAWLKDVRLATAGFDKTLKLWDVSTAKAVQSTTIVPDLVFSLAAHPDGELLAWGGKDKSARLLRLGASDGPKELASQAKSIYRLAFNPDGKLLAACGEDDPKVYLWDVAQAKLVKQLTCEDPDDKNLRRSLFGVAFNPDGTQLACCGADRSVRLWDIESGKELRRFESVEYTVFREKDKQLEREAKQGASEFAVYAVAFSPDGKTIASGGLDKTVRLWDAASGELKQTLAGHKGFVNELHFTPRGDRLFTSGHGGKLHLWNIATGKEEWSAELPALAQAAALSPDGSRVAVACADTKVYLVTLPR